MKVAAFFDLDGTLVSVNTASLWMKRERRLGRINLYQQFMAIFYMLCYRFGVVNIEEVTIKALQTVKGLNEEEVRKWTHEWFEKEVTPYAAPDAFDAIKEHRNSGHILVLLTSASLYESEIAAKFFGMDAFLCSRYEVKDGVFTGGIILPLCYGHGKVIHARNYASENNIDLSISYFYSDSITDLPMLMAVGNPRAVNPDFRLSREAKKRGWPILDWKSKVTK